MHAAGFDCKLLDFGLNPVEIVKLGVENADVDADINIDIEV